MTNNHKYYFFTYRAKPNPSNPEYNEVGGAYINAWATNKINGDLNQTIKARIELEDWKVEKLEENHTVTRRGYSENSEMTEAEKNEIFELLDLADEHGLSLAFYAWEKE